jgi:hypothetical protein
MADQPSSGISGIGIAAVFAGGILLWSAIKGFSVSGVFRNIIAGKDPATLSNVNPVSVGGLFNPFNLLSSGSSQTTGTGTTGKATVIGSGQGESWARSFLATIGAPQTSANIQSVMAWIHREGGGGKNNPLNTTLSMPGATDFNSVGVKNYATIAIGILANAKTLMGGGYSDVLSALKSGHGLCGQSFSGLSRWSGGGYSSVC